MIQVTSGDIPYNFNDTFNVEVIDVEARPPTPEAPIVRSEKGGLLLTWNTVKQDKYEIQWSRDRTFLNDINEVIDDEGMLVLQLSYTPLMLKQLAFDIKCKTIERFSEYIFERLESLYGPIPMEISLTKCSPPIAGFTGNVSITRKRNTIPLTYEYNYELSYILNASSYFPVFLYKSPSLI